jgi:hypothetical protein
VVVLSTSGALGAVIVSVFMVVRAAIALVVAAIMIVVTSFLMTVVMAVLGAIGSSNLLGFFDVDVAVCHLYHLADGHMPLVVKLSLELLVMEPLSECSDSFTVADVGMEFLVSENRLMKPRRDS